ncbi:MAG: hypothetical protein U9R47_04460 [Actinomycetota bacterium]|nr:hypothetical protein [Actinomycetota bacterium]
MRRVVRTLLLIMPLLLAVGAVTVDVFDPLAATVEKIRFLGGSP